MDDEILTICRKEKEIFRMQYSAKYAGLVRTVLVAVWLSAWLAVPIGIILLVIASF